MLARFDVVGSLCVAIGAMQNFGNELTQKSSDASNS